MLAALGTVLGTILGLAGSYYLQEVGLDLSIFAGTYSVGGVAFDPIWRATIVITSYSIHYTKLYEVGSLQPLSLL